MMECYSIVFDVVYLGHLHELRPVASFDTFMSKILA